MKKYIFEATVLETIFAENEEDARAQMNELYMRSNFIFADVMDV
jgi:hypothetical protein